MNIIRTFLIVGATAASLGASAAYAGVTPILGLYDTGVDGFGAPLAENAVDTHWLVSGASPFVYDNPGYMKTSDARFIAQNVGGGYVTNPNSYTLTFFLAANRVSSAQLSGFFEADNYATAFLNGHQLAQDIQGTAYENFQSLTAFNATSVDFQSNLNTLTFVVTDTGPPAALLVSGLNGSAGAVPEPSAWALMISGFGLAGAALRRRRVVAATA